MASTINTRQDINDPCSHAFDSNLIYILCSPAGIMLTPLGSKRVLLRGKVTLLGDKHSFNLTFKKLLEALHDFKTSWVCPIFYLDPRIHTKFHPSSSDINIF